MLRSFWWMLCASFVFSSCLKKESGCPYSSSSVVASAAETQQVQDYLTSNNITAVKHTSGMFYEIIENGTGKTPDLCSQIGINYQGKLTNGNIFDQRSGVVYVLGALIEGWKKGLPLIQAGGRIKLYIPPSLGYGANPRVDDNGNVVIPANSILIFDITLSSVQ